MRYCSTSSRTDRTCRIWSLSLWLFRRIFRGEIKVHRIFLFGLLERRGRRNCERRMNGTIFRVDRECFLVPVLPAFSGGTIMVAVEEYRLDKDSMGEVKVPSSAYYGAETQRAVQNFPISGLRLPKEFVRAMALIKLSAARANMQLGLLDPKKGEAIVSAAKEIMEGALYDQ